MSVEKTAEATYEGVKGASKWAAMFAAITGTFATVGSMFNVFSKNHAHSSAQSAVNTDHGAINATESFNAEMHYAATKPVTLSEVQAQERQIMANWPQIQRHGRTHRTITIRP